MKGSVRKRYNNAWSYRIDLGFVDGKRKQVEKGGFKTEREATKAMQDVLYHLNNTGDYVENKKVSFHTVYEDFIEREGKATRAYATLKRYDSLYRNHIKDEFGPLYVYQISDTMIIDFLNQKRIKYSEEYVKGMYKFFNVILRYAHDHKYTKKNVMDLVPPPPDPRHVGDIVTYNRKELEQMIERIESTRSKIAFQLGLQAGLRESECFALTWSDIDFEKKKIKVCKQLLYQDMTSGYGEEEGKADDPLILKSQFVMSLCEQLMKPEPVGAKERSIIGRCVGNVYREYIKDYRNPPTLKDFREELLRQPEPQAQSIALALELFVDGTLDVFAYQTNVDMSNRIMLFDIFDLGSQLKTVGMLVMLDAILNRVIENHKRGRRTWIYIDEIYLFFANEYSSNFLEESWKRFRKKNAAATGITQNVTDCLRSPTAKNMLANSEFLLMLSQAPTDQQELVKMLRISEEQLSYISNAESGHGLIKVGGAKVPFINQFPRNTALYRLMTTKPGESL